MEDFLDDVNPHSSASQVRDDDSQEENSLCFEATPADVVQLIEQLACDFCEQLGALGVVPELLLKRATTSWQADAAPLRTVSLFDRQGLSAVAYIRLFCLLDLVHDLLLNNQQASQRDIFYRLKHLPIFSTPEHVNQAIQGLVGLLHVPRAALGIVCSSRGVYFGRMMVREAPGCAWTDCSNIVGGGKAIPGDCRAITEFEFASEARFVIIVEKEAIFQRLVDDDFHALADCILVTARGMPDIATRAFVHGLLEAVPHLIPVALVDWNPSGMAILAVYKYGSQRMREAARYAVPGLRWLGARGALLHGVANPALQGPLSRRDLALAASLRAGALAAEPAWLEELDAMQDMDATAELEALYEHPAGFSVLLADALARKLYV